MIAEVIGYVVMSFFEFLGKRFWVSRLRKFQMLALKVLVRRVLVPPTPPFFGILESYG